MDAAVVIKVVDVDPDVVFGVRVIGVPFLVDPFAFQASKETLHRCVIPAIPLPAHASERCRLPSVRSRSARWCTGIPDPSGTSLLAADVSGRSPAAKPG